MVFLLFFLFCLLAGVLPIQDPSRRRWDVCVSWRSSNSRTTGLQVLLRAMHAWLLHQCLQHTGSIPDFSDVGGDALGVLDVTTSLATLSLRRSGRVENTIQTARLGKLRDSCGIFELDFGVAVTLLRRVHPRRACRSHRADVSRHTRQQPVRWVLLAVLQHDGATTATM